MISARSVLQIARREIVATVLTKGFLIGVLIVPLIMGAMVLVLPRMMLDGPRRVVGEVAILDLTGAVLPGVQERLRPEALAENRRRIFAEIDRIPMGGLLGGDSSATAASMLGEVPQFSVTEVRDTAALAAARARLIDSVRGEQRLLAVVVVHPDAVVVPAGASPGSYDLLVRESLSERVVSEVQGAVDRAIIDARLAHRALDAAEIKRLTRVAEVRPREVRQGGERETNMIASTMLPMGFMMLLLLSVMTGGGQLLTSTIEEKSNRVMEVLLSAVSPGELMAGKILGQMAVGFLLLALYAGLGLVGLLSGSLLCLKEPMAIVYLVAFFLVAFITMSSLMAAIGSAVSDARDAQALLTPVMLINFLPMMLWMPISQDPGSMLARGASFAPAVGPFVAVLRMVSATPPAAWETALALAVGAAWAAGAIWFAGRVFRIGVLLQGKPPSFRTLIRWAVSGA